MSNTTITIEQAMQAAQAEIEAMTFRIGDPNYPHAQAAHELIRAIRGWYAQAQAREKADPSPAAAGAPHCDGEREMDAAPDQESMEQTERECEA